jgi:transposase InsO family protein
MQRELLDRQRGSTQADIGSANVEWIEAFSNPRRPHSPLGYLPPIEFGNRHAAALTAA